MAVVVLYDACVLYPASLRDFLMRLATRKLVQAKWSGRILDEMTFNLLKNQPELRPDRLATTRERMCRAVPDCLVEGYEHLEDGLVLPDAEDRHVAAAAIHCGAKAIITFNVRDFPGSVLDSRGVSALTPDELVLSLAAESATLRLILEAQARDLKRTPVTVQTLMSRLSVVGLPESMRLLSE